MAHTTLEWWIKISFSESVSLSGLKESIKEEKQNHKITRQLAFGVAALLPLRKTLV